MYDLSFLRPLHLETKLCTPPLPPLRVVPDLVTSAHANPVWDRSVLPGLLGEGSLSLKCLVGRLQDGRKKSVSLQIKNYKHLSFGLGKCERANDGEG